eukprot:6477527-Amphidinium_carterae.1
MFLRLRLHGYGFYGQYLLLGLYSLGPKCSSVSMQTMCGNEGWLHRADAKWMTHKQILCMDPFRLLRHA